MSLKQKAGKYFEQSSSQYYDDLYKFNPDSELWERHHLILKLVGKYGGDGGSRILDMGCGPGLLTMDLAGSRHTVTGMDVAPSMIEMAESTAKERKMDDKIIFMLGDAENTGLDAEAFDFVIAAGVIEYMDSDGPILEEAKRLLKPGGYIIISLTNLFGYKSMLVPITHRLKRLRTMKCLGDVLKGNMSRGEREVIPLPFVPRRHIPWHFRRLLADNGFAFVDDEYLGYSFLPSPFSVLFQRITGPLDKKLQALNGTRLRIIGTTCLVVGKKL